jgi:hypothetical protein
MFEEFLERAAAVAAATPCGFGVSVQWPDRFLGPWGLQIELRRVTRCGRPGHLIPEGSKQLAGGKRSATTGKVRGPAGLNGGIKRCPTDSHRPRRAL